MPGGVEIEVIYHDRCPHLMDAACELAKAVADLRWNGEVRVRHRSVNTPEEAHECGFAGWPLLRVNGRGITPEACARHPPEWSGCRHYPCPEGPQHYPRAREIRVAIEEAIIETANT